MTGLFHLRTARDLLAKLRHDGERLKRNHVDAHAAFDFFVTATHLADWLHQGDEDKAKAMIKDNALLRVCRDIANGSKHFEARSTRPVKGTALVGGIFDPAIFDPNIFQVGAMVIELDGGQDAEAVTLLGASIEVRELAGRVLEFWEKELR
jgi:hypothetical protein